MAVKVQLIDPNRHTWATITRLDTMEAQIKANMNFIRVNIHHLDILTRWFKVVDHDRKN